MPTRVVMIQQLALVLALVIGLYIGSNLPALPAQDTPPPQNGEEEVVPDRDLGKLDRIPPTMIYQWMQIPVTDEEIKLGGRPMEGIFLYDTVNETMRIYAFNNLTTRGSRGDIELLAVRDVRWDAMLNDTGYTERGDEAPELVKYKAQGMRPADIFELLKKTKIIDKDGNRLKKDTR